MKRAHNFSSHPSISLACAGLFFSKQSSFGYFGLFLHAGHSSIQTSAVVQAWFEKGSSCRTKKLRTNALLENTTLPESPCVRSHAQTWCPLRTPNQSFPSRYHEMNKDLQASSVHNTQQQQVRVGVTIVQGTRDLHHQLLFPPHDHALFLTPHTP